MFEVCELTGGNGIDGANGDRRLPPGEKSEVGIGGIGLAWEKRTGGIVLVLGTGWAAIFVFDDGSG